MSETSETFHAGFNTETETVERFVLDQRDCVDGGDGCKAQMRHSVAGAFVYHSEIAILVSACQSALDYLERSELGDLFVAQALRKALKRSAREKIVK